MASCSRDVDSNIDSHSQELQKSSHENTTSNTINANEEELGEEELNYYKQWYINLSSWINNNTSVYSSDDFSESYVLAPDNTNIEMLSVSLDSESIRAIIPSEYDVKGFINDVDFSNYINSSEDYHAIILQREISLEENNVYIKEFISVKTGEIFYHNVTGMSEEQYSNFVNNYYENDYYLQGDICFTTLEACEEVMNQNTSTGINGALCDYLPCGTMNYLACQMAEQGGQIQSSCNFAGCEYCDVIIGTPYVEPADLYLEGPRDIQYIKRFEIQPDTYLIH